MILAYEHTSIAIQLTAAVLAVIWIRKTPNITWLLITFALLLIGSRKLLSLLGVMPPAFLPEIVGSIVVVCAIFLIQTLFKQFNQNIGHLKSLREIDQAMLSNLSHKGVMNAIIDKLNTTLNTDAAAVLTLTENGNKGFKLNAIATYNLSKRLQEYVQTISNGFVSSVIINRRPLIISRIVDDEDERFLATLRDEGFVSYLGAPILIRGSIPIGVLTLYARKPRQYTAKELEFINAICNQIAITLDRSQLLGRIQELNFESVRALVEAIELRDPYTRGHSLQVADLAVKLAKAMGFPEQDLALIAFAGLLHDIGKIAVPEAILKKKSTLTGDEWQTIRRHPTHSAKIIEPVLNLKPIQDWILHHHERWDGNGYPSGKKEKEIPVQSRILAVCDTCSAMLEDRPYRKGMDLESIRKEIRRVAGTQLDPAVVENFLRLDLKEFCKKYVGSLESQIQLPLNAGKEQTVTSLFYPDVSHSEIFHS